MRHCNDVRYKQHCIMKASRPVNAMVLHECTSAINSLPRRIKTYQSVPIQGDWQLQGSKLDGLNAACISPECLICSPHKFTRNGEETMKNDTPIFKTDRGRSEMDALSICDAWETVSGITLPGCWSCHRACKQGHGPYGR